MTEFKKAVILITGATGGFGQELTRQLLEYDSRLILSDIDETVLLKQAETIQKQITTGEIIACIPCDLSSREECETLYHQVKALKIPIDILINNAGMAVFGRMDEVPEQEWERLMQINLLAPMRLSTLFVADMIARRKGHIVNISSVAGWVALGGMAHYAASKYGLRGFSEGLFNEVKAYNVQVTAVYPFFSRTPILQSKRYGTLAEKFSVPPNITTDPAQVMRETLQGIIDNKVHIFPDATGKQIQFVKRYFPDLLDWLIKIYIKRLKQ